ncbi:hypothetical protein H9P43_004822 [Blastocladiella emersonii ATCC 22665]|nr:hypothetical protein H9P43_004822 [Blastocladiella emersonii ATCC 22665]
MNGNGGLHFHLSGTSIRLGDRNGGGGAAATDGRGPAAAPRAGCAAGGASTRTRAPPPPPPRSSAKPDPPSPDDRPRFDADYHKNPARVAWITPEFPTRHRLPRAGSGSGANGSGSDLSSAAPPAAEPAAVTHPPAPPPSHHRHHHHHHHAAKDDAPLPTPPYSPIYDAGAGDTLDSPSSSSSSGSDPAPPRPAAAKRPPARAPYYDWKHLKQQTHRRNTEQWAMETIVIRRLRYLVDHLDELNGEHVPLLSSLETSGVSPAQIQQYFPYVHSVHDLKVHLTALLAERHPHAEAPYIDGSRPPRSLTERDPAKHVPDYPPGKPSIARRQYGHTQPLVTPLAVLKIVEQFHPVAQAVATANGPVPQPQPPPPPRQGGGTRSKARPPDAAAAAAVGVAATARGPGKSARSVAVPGGGARP